MRIYLRLLGCLALALAGCQVAPHTTGRKEAQRTNSLSNKHTVTESPTLERPEPTPPPGP